MTATQNLSQRLEFNKTLKPTSHGVLMLLGYGIQVRVDRGHLLVEDGVGSERRQFRLPRVGHGLRRLVVIGNDGMVSLAALRWLADQDAAFVMLERDGHVLTTTGPVRPSDARLRRAQALAEHSGAALCIARELISRKLAGQERVARDKLLDSKAAEIIAQFRAEVDRAETMDTVRRLESQGASFYWAAWHDLPICFPKNDLRRVPDHWRAFDTRKSPLSGSQRLAANPVNAILNYLYAVLESEARLAAAALGLDPGLGFIHMDAPARDSLACDLMEPVRPEVDAWVLGWITREPLKREWFFEQRDGTCRLMGSFAVRLSETAPTWARAVAPYAEWIARTLWSTLAKSKREPAPATRLTQRRRREVKGSSSRTSSEPVPRPERICVICGTPLATGLSYCRLCAVPVAIENLAAVAVAGRAAGQMTSHGPEAQARRANARRRHALAKSTWHPSSLPAWLNEETYLGKIQPLLAGLTNKAVASELGSSIPYASAIRAGRRVPHPRHWQALAQLVGLSADRSDCGRAPEMLDK
jgi:CRISPR-associated endonuclease Cas1